MSKNSNRRGLALGAMFSLVASLFVGATPASAAPSTTAFNFEPVLGTSFSTLLTEDFHMVVQRDTSVVSAQDFNEHLAYEITTNRAFSSSTYSVGVITGTYSGAVANIASHSFNVSISAFTAVASSEYRTSVPVYQGGILYSLAQLPQLVAATYAETQSYVVVPGSRSASVNNFIGLTMGQYGAGLYATSESGAVTVTVRAFLDLNNDKLFNAASEPSATQTVSFIKFSSVTRTVTVPSVVATQTVVTISAVVSGINTQQLDGKWSVRVNQWGPTGLIAATSYSPSAESSFTFSAPATLQKQVNIVSASASNSISADLVYFALSYSPALTYSDLIYATAQAFGQAGGATTGENYNSFSTVIRWANAGTQTSDVVGATGVSLYGVAGTNLLAGTTGLVGTDGTSTFRSGSRTFTVRLSTSGNVSGATATFTFSNAALSGTKTYAVDGGTQINTGTFSSITKTIPSNGLVDLPFSTVGFATGNTITIHAQVSGVSGAIKFVLTCADPVYTVVGDSTQVAVAPGGSANLGVTVRDQFLVNSTATDQRIRFIWATGYSGTATQSDVLVVAGRATATVVHSPASSTLSATMRAILQDSTGGVFTERVGANHETFSFTVTSATNGFRTGLAVSYSATISYGTAYSWSPVINDAFVVVTGSLIVVSGTGLIFKDDVVGNIATDSITLPGDSAGRVKFYVTARKAGSYTVTLTAGTATTTSLIVVRDAQDNAGKAIAFDVSSMESGRAAIVTGTLTDLNGNPVDTSLGNASIALTVTGTGATYVGSLAAETNADGKFQVALLSGPGQTGTMTITAVYSPTSNAAAADKVTKVQTVSVLAAAVPEVNAVIGSFNGRWAVRVENAKGSVVSVKAGKKWAKFNALNNNYLYSIKSVKGSTIAISVWVDGELQNSQTITIK
jgi:hypothetical protein